MNIHQRKQEFGENLIFIEPYALSIVVCFGGRVPTLFISPLPALAVVHLAISTPRFLGFYAASCLNVSVL